MEKDANLEIWQRYGKIRQCCGNQRKKKDANLWIRRHNGKKKDANLGIRRHNGKKKDANLKIRHYNCHYKATTTAVGTGNVDDDCGGFFSSWRWAWADFWSMAWMVRRS